MRSALLTKNKCDSVHFNELMKCVKRYWILAFAFVSVFGIGGRNSRLRIRLLKINRHQVLHLRILH